MQSHTCPPPGGGGGCRESPCFTAFQYAPCSAWYSQRPDRYYTDQCACVISCPSKLHLQLNALKIYYISLNQYIRYSYPSCSPPPNTHTGKIHESMYSGKFYIPVSQLNIIQRLKTDQCMRKDIQFVLHKLSNTIFFCIASQSSSCIYIYIINI